MIYAAIVPHENTFRTRRALVNDMVHYGIPRRTCATAPTERLDTDCQSKPVFACYRDTG